MKKIVSFLIALIFFIQCIAANADDCREPIAVTKPCDGVLLPPEAAAEGLKCLEVELPMLELAMDRENELCSARLDAAKLREQALMDYNKQLEVLLDTALTVDPEVKPFWETNVFWAASGFLAGSLTAVAITFALAGSLD